MLKSIVQPLLELYQALRSDHFFGEPVPVPNHPQCAKPFPGIQPKYPLIQFHAVSLSSGACHKSDEIGNCK